jgi:inner membrane protein
MNKAGWAKALGLGLVGLGLTIVLTRIGWLVEEREQRQLEAQQEVAAATAGPQLLGAPFLRRQCTESWTIVEVVDDERGRRETRRREQQEHSLRSPPARLAINGELKPQTLERGLFKVNTYLAALQLKADWDDLAALRPQSRRLEGQMVCEAPELALEISDARGLRQVTLNLNGQALKLAPGNGAGKPGLHVQLSESSLAQPLELQGQLELLGTESLQLLPAAAQMQASLHSSWPHPSFQGRFLPNERKVHVQGFSATWRLTELASDATAAVREGKASNDHFGVSLIDPVNPYSLSDRALKYGFLFIALTLAAVMLAELLGRHRLHPMQYGFVGLAMAMFFLLLLALSEHLAFGIAYAVAAGCATLLLAHYASGLFGHWRGGALFGTGVALLYGALYVVLNLERAALLLGSLLLFALLAAAMRATRDVDWYGLGRAASN